MKTIGKLIFKDCSFKDIDTHLCTFMELEFSNCIFDNNVIFRDCIFHKLTFYNCNFSHNVSLQKTHFSGESIFKDSVFKGEINCNTSCFTENIYFNNATFKGYVDFHECEFKKNACFYGVTFDKAPNFSQAIFKGNLNFVNVTYNFDFKDLQESIQKEKDKQQDDKKFNENKEEKDKKPLDKFANDFRDSFRLIKNALIKENNLLEATNFHKYELYCKEIEPKENWNKKPINATNEKEMQININKFRDFINSLLLGFYRKLCEHHTDLLKVCNNLILLIALYALFVYIGGYEIRQNSSSILDTNLSSNISLFLINFKEYILNLPFIKEYYIFILMSFVILYLLYLMITMYRILKDIKKIGK